MLLTSKMRAIITSQHSIAGPVGGNSCENLAEKSLTEGDGNTVRVDTAVHILDHIYGNLIMVACVVGNLAMTRKYTLSDEVYLKHLIDRNAKKQRKKSFALPMWRETYNIVVLGSAMVGKSSIIERLVRKSFPEHYAPTVAEVYETRIEMFGKRKTGNEVRLRIYDTCGSQSFPLETGLTIDHGDAFVIVYSVDSEKTLSDAERLLEDINQRDLGRVSKPCVLVGNKSDARSDCRQVTSEQGLQVAVRSRSAFLETSAKGSHEDIEELFRSLVKKVECQSCLQLLRQNDAKIVKDLHRPTTSVDLFPSCFLTSNFQRIYSL